MKPQSALLVGFVLFACGEDRLGDANRCQPGTETCACLDGRQCDAGLVCLADTCERGQPDPHQPANEPLAEPYTEPVIEPPPPACDPTTPGGYVSTPAASFSCGFGSVRVNITSWQFSAAGSELRATPSTSSSGPLTGPMPTCPGGSFVLTKTLPGGCCETYELAGAFTGPNSWAATFTARFCQDVSCGCAQGDGYSCNNAGLDPCATTSVQITGSR